MATGHSQTINETDDREERPFDPAVGDRDSNISTFDRGYSSQEDREEYREKWPKDPTGRPIKPDLPVRGLETHELLPNWGNQSFKPVLNQYVGACINVGNVFSISGRNLDRLDPQKVAVEVNHKAVLLPVIRIKKTHISIRLPKDIVKSGHQYNLVLAERSNASHFVRTGINIKTCAGHDLIYSDLDVKRNVLIFFDRKRRSEIISELEKLSAEIVRESNLEALQRVMLSVRSSNNIQLIADLRRSFPDLTIDFNSDLNASNDIQQTAKPRLYAAKQINWPQSGKDIINSDICLKRIEGLAIGILDGAIKTDHSALKKVEVISRNFLDQSKPDLSHATAIASILSSKDDQNGQLGLMNNIKIFNAISLRQTSGGQILAGVEETIRGLNWLMANQVRLINVSLASPRANEVLVDAFSLSIKQGYLIFAAAGNEGASAPPSYPANIEGVVAVTAIDAGKRNFSAANIGGYIDFAAPGVDIWAANSNGGSSYVSGTSYAVPYAVASAALLLSKNQKMPSSVMLGLMKRVSIDLGETGKDNIYGHGLVQALCLR
ncbi:S8 family serine peptidase [Curvivirga sp.]|uniref:S8 family serine peptidase n=1 Tax=Curvivirga sp. TaxID=2856848 RepID=UPI003B58D9F2